MLYSEYLEGAFHDHGANPIDAEIFHVLERLYNGNNAITKQEIYKAGKELHDVVYTWQRKHEYDLMTGVIEAAILTFKEV